VASDVPPGASLREMAFDWDEMETLEEKNADIISGHVLWQK